MGASVAGWTDSLSQGWNIIGSVYGEPVAVDGLDDIPSGTLQKGTLYWWDPATKSYQTATEVEQGKGYWAACSENCELAVGLLAT